MNTITLNCENCNKPFQAYPSRVKHGRGKNCSKECQYVSTSRQRASRVTRKCVGCKKKFKLLESTLNTSKGTGTYCSLKCRTKYRRGPLNSNWQGGSTEYKRGNNWSRQRRKALKRDKHRCQECGSKKRQMHVHHVIPYRMFANYKYANKLRNLITLCDKCHRTTEAELRWIDVRGNDDEDCYLSALAVMPGSFMWNIHQMVMQRNR